LNSWTRFFSDIELKDSFVVRRSGDGSVIANGQPDFDQEDDLNVGDNSPQNTGLMQISKMNL
tara:strand:- start:179 stop:364 length:186 start_codon:yes stop_codon:yes gene_type:complete